MPNPSPARIHDFTVVANEPIAQGIMCLRMHAPALAAALKPGQFVNVRVPGNAMSLLRVPLSFAGNDPVQGTIDIWYAVVGDGTRRLAQMRPGDTSDVLGPGGNGWTVPENTSELMVVGGGIGTPPVVALAAAARAANPACRIHAVVGARTAAALTGVAELTALCGSENVHLATDDGTAGHYGFVTDVARDVLAGGSIDRIAACGPEPMMAAVAASAAERDIACEVSVERMMSCGFGACATCAVETTGGMKGACMCGPVFDAKEVVW